MVVTPPSPPPIVHEYAPFGAARELFHSREPELLLAGAAGTGKTVAALHKAALVAMKYPRSNLLITRKVARSLGPSTLRSFEERVIGELLTTGAVRFFGGSTNKPAAYQFKSNRSQIVVGGLDDPIKIMSTEYDMIVVDEATETTVTDWESLKSRLRNGRVPYQQLIGCCNPDAPHHWLHQRADQGILRMLVSTIRDNPLYWDAETGTFTPAGHTYVVENLGASLTGVRRARLLDGQWVAAEGIIYEGFRRELHVIDRMPEGWEAWPRVWSIDWGTVNPMVVQFWARDHDGRLYLYRELYHTQTLVEDMARKVMSIVAPDGEWIEPRPEAVVADHDLGERKVFTRHTGLVTVAARKDVLPGIEKVQLRLRPAKDGLPRLFIVAGARLERDGALLGAGKPTSTIEEFGSYVWKPGPDGKPTPDEPLKIDDHGMDATRYAVAHHDLRIEARVRF
jgi:PBSX family phage terminase large subunit